MYKELKHIDKLCINKLKKRPLSIIKTYHTTTAGQEHMFWATAKNLVPKCIKWVGLTGQERGMITRCAELLHKQDIPYGFYIDYLVKMHKQHYVSQSPLYITKYVTKEDGNPSLLAEYLSMMKFLLKTYREMPNIIRIVDKVYLALPTAYLEGSLKYIHTVLQVQDSLTSHTTNEVLQVLNRSKSIHEFWNNLGTSVNDLKPDFVLDKGISAQGSLKVLQREIRIRLGKEHGKINKELDKYFKKNNRLNIKGLAVISGTKQL